VEVKERWAAKYRG